MDTSNTKLRVTHIITMLELGGAQDNTLYTVSHLNANRFEPSLICGKGGMLDKEAEASAWPPFYVRWLVRPLKPLYDVLALVTIYRLLRRTRPHIVHTHSSKAGIIGRIAAYFAGVPVIIHTFHGFGFNREQKPWTRALFITLEKICAQLSTYLIFVSEANRSEAEALGIGMRIPRKIIRSGIKLSEAQRSQTSPWRSDENRHQPSVLTRQKLGVPEGAWEVCYIGNFKPQKNPMGLAHVAAEVLKIAKDIHFVLVGDGPLRDKVETWCREQGIADHMHFPKWCRRDDVSRILADADCFLLTSLWEGLPRALVEAFAAGCPAVAYAVDGVQDILKDGENGFLIPPGKVSLAAEKILWLKENPINARKMGAKGNKAIEKEFDIDLMVRQQEELYNALYEAVPLKDYYESRWIPEKSSDA